MDPNSAPEQQQQQTSSAKSYMWLIIGGTALSIMIGGLAYWYFCCGSPYDKYETLLVNAIDNVKDDVMSKEDKLKTTYGIRQFCKLLNAADADAAKKTESDKHDTVDLTGITLRAKFGSEAEETFETPKQGKDSKDDVRNKVFDSLIKWKDFHKISAIGATVTYTLDADSKPKTPTKETVQIASKSIDDLAKEFSAPPKPDAKGEETPNKVVYKPLTAKSRRLTPSEVVLLSVKHKPLVVMEAILDEIQRLQCA